MSKPTTLLGDSSAMARLLTQIDRVATTPLPILLVGETGTGKEVMARRIHELSGRRGPFIPVDCAALSASLIESELFGHERGAFTGANQRRDGLVHAARGGTFFLDEIGELPDETQTRLLRLLEQATFRPVGAEFEREADIRVVAATWRHLEDLVKEGQFRRDLYHRLSIVELQLPPLRARGDDVALLLEHYMDAAAQEMARTAPTLDSRARHFLLDWPWPGNVRELRNTANYIVAMTRGPTVRIEDLPPQMLRGKPDVSDRQPHTVIAAPNLRIDLPYMEARRQWLDDFQQRYVEAILEQHDGNVSAAARSAEMDRRSIQRILARERNRGADG